MYHAKGLNSSLALCLDCVSQRPFEGRKTWTTRSKPFSFTITNETNGNKKANYFKLITSSLAFASWSVVLKAFGYLAPIKLIWSTNGNHNNPKHVSRFLFSKIVFRPLIGYLFTPTRHEHSLICSDSLAEFSSRRNVRKQIPTLCEEFTLTVRKSELYVLFRSLNDILLSLRRQNKLISCYYWSFSDKLSQKLLVFLLN